MAVKTLLDISGAKYKVHNIHLDKGDQRHPDYL